MPLQMLLLFLLLFEKLRTYCNYSLVFLVGLCECGAVLPAWRSLSLRCRQPPLLRSSSHFPPSAREEEGKTSLLLLLLLLLFHVLRIFLFSTFFFFFFFLFLSFFFKSSSLLQSSSSFLRSLVLPTSLSLFSLSLCVRAQYLRRDKWVANRQNGI